MGLPCMRGRETTDNHGRGVFSRTHTHIATTKGTAQAAQPDNLSIRSWRRRRRGFTPSPSNTDASTAHGEENANPQSLYQALSAEKSCPTPRPLKGQQGQLNHHYLEKCVSLRLDPTQGPACALPRRTPRRSTMEILPTARGLWQGGGLLRTWQPLCCCCFIFSSRLLQRKVPAQQHRCKSSPAATARTQACTN